jgi:hypothetical protein
MFRGGAGGDADGSVKVAQAPSSLTMLQLAELKKQQRDADQASKRRATVLNAPPKRQAIPAVDDAAATQKPTVAATVPAVPAPTPHTNNADKENQQHRAQHTVAAAPAASSETAAAAAKAKTPARHNYSYVNITSLIDASITDLKTRHANTLQTCTPGPLWQTMNDRRYHQHASTGDELLAATRSALARSRLKRTYVQRRFHEMALNICAPVLYSAEWQTRREAVMQRNNWRDYPPMGAAMYARVCTRGWFVSHTHCSLAR